MGHVVVEAELAWKRAARVRVLLDTGATHSMLPSDLADRLGVVRSPRGIRVELADGSRRTMRVGTVIVRLLGREAGDAALIARRGTEPILGVEALEALGLTVDPPLAQAEADPRARRSARQHATCPRLTRLAGSAC